MFFCALRKLLYLCKYEIKTHNKANKMNTAEERSIFKCIKTLEGHSGCVNSVAYSPDGSRIISSSYKFIPGKFLFKKDKTIGIIEIWDAKKGKCLKTLEGHLDCVTSVVYSPDGKYIVSGSRDKTIKIWDANTVECLKTLKGHSEGVNSVAYSPDSSRIISGSDEGTIKIWDFNTRRCLKTLKGHSWIVHSVAYSPDGTKIISCSADKTIKIWGEE